jgi:glucose-6-phosphate 1-dehydrogenase
MNSKDQKLLEEAYTKVCEGLSNRVDYFEAALKDPKSFEVTLDRLTDEDWEGNATYHTVAYIYQPPNHKDYDRCDNPDDIEQIVDAFEKHNPEGITDNR